MALPAAARGGGQRRASGEDRAAAGPTIPGEAPALTAMTDDQLQRYARHLLLDDIGIEGQQRLLDAHALVIGAGGLGRSGSRVLFAARRQGRHAAAEEG